AGWPLRRCAAPPPAPSSGSWPSRSGSDMSTGRAGPGARGRPLPGPARCGVPGAGADPVDAGARTDVQRAPVGPAEAAVGHLLRHRDLAELLPARGEHLDAGGGGGPEVPVRVHAEAVW